MLDTLIREPGQLQIEKKGYKKVLIIIMCIYLRPNYCAEDFVLKKKKIIICESLETLEMRNQNRRVQNKIPINAYLNETCHHQLAKVLDN